MWTFEIPNGHRRKVGEILKKYSSHERPDLEGMIDHQCSFRIVQMASDPVVKNWHAQRG